MSAASLLRLAILLVPVVLALAAGIHVWFALHAAGGGRRDPLYVERLAEVVVALADEVDEPKSRAA